MTDKEFLDKVMEMVPDIQVLVLKKAMVLRSNGVIKLDDYEDNYHLPKIFMQYIGMEITRQYSGSKKDRAIANTIYHTMR